MKRKGLIGWFAPALLLTASAFSHAFIVTIEPDDYAVGTDLSNVSPYVTLEARYTSPVTGTSVGPIRAVAASPNHPAPTGNVSFGSHAYSPSYTVDPIVYSGFTLTFHQEVSQVTLLASDGSYMNLKAEWIAFDRNGNTIGHGLAGGDGKLGELGQNFLIDIQLDNLWSVVVGGQDAIRAVNFYHLSFNVVPEPSTWMLLAPGLLALVLRRKSPARLMLNPQRQR